MIRRVLPFGFWFFAIVLFAQPVAGAPQVASGTYVGNGFDGRAIGGLPFSPDLVVIKSDDNSYAVARTSTMTGDVSKELVDRGALIPDNIQGFTADGFTVGGDNQVNKAGTDYTWIAFLSDPGEMTVGTYVGDGVDSRGVSSGFLPGYVLVLSEDNEVAMQRFETQATGFSSSFGGDAQTAGAIQGFTSTGFLVGTDPSVNQAGITHHYVAWRSEPQHVTIGSYTGDNVDGRRIVGTSFQPDYVVIKAESNRSAAHHPGALSADATLSFDAVANYPDGIQSLVAGGFDVGRDQTVNQNGVTYHWVAFRTARSADLDVSITVDQSTPFVGNVVQFTIDITNAGPDSTSGVEVLNLLPPGLTYQSSQRTSGNYNPVTGVWAIDSLPPGQSAALLIDALVDEGTEGTQIPNSVNITASDVADQNLANNSDSVAVAVQQETRIASGVYVGDGIGGRAFTGLGFQPDVVWIKGTGATASVVRTSTMPAGQAKPLLDQGPISGAIQSLDAGGFTVGSDTRVNELDATYQWVALLSAPGELAVGSYVGTGGFAHQIQGVGFQPDYVLVMNEDKRHPAQRFVTQNPGESLPLGPEGAQNNLISAFLPDGFQVEQKLDVNQFGITHHYIALKATPSRIAVGSHVGDGTKSRNLPSGLGRGDFALLKGDASIAGTHRAAALTGSGSPSLIDDALYPDAITALDAGGLLLGDHPAVNSTGVTYHWVMLGGTRGADLRAALTASDTTPDPETIVTLTVEVDNAGPEDATNVAALVSLPSSVTFQSASASTGSFNVATNTWNIGDLTNGTLASLQIDALVDADAGGSSLPVTVSLPVVDQMDPALGNESPSLLLSVPTPYLVATGTYRGDGRAARAVTGVGFQPDAVLLKSRDKSEAVLRTSTMAGVSKRLTGGVSTEIGLIESLDADGFSVGGADVVNATGVDYDWIAFQAQDGELVVGSYVGDGIDNRDILGLGLRPDYAIVVGEVDEPAMQRFGVQTAGLSIPLQAEGEKGDRIQDFLGDGFQVGLHSSVNSLGVAYHYVAWAGDANSVVVGSYAGDGAKERLVGDAGFLPDWVTIKGAFAEGGAHRPRTMPDARSAVFAAQKSIYDGITGLAPAGFRLGTDLAVNATGRTYFWAAFRATESADLGVSVEVDDRHPQPGQRVHYLLALTNDGPLDANSIAVNFPLPQGVTYITSAASTGNYNPGTGSWSVAGLVAGEQYTLDVEVSVDAGTSESVLVATATIGDGSRIVAPGKLPPTGLPLDSNKGNDTATSQLIVDYPMEIATGSYLGDGLDDRVISTVGFQPDVVMIKGFIDEFAVLRTSTMIGDAAKILGTNAALAPNTIQSLTLNGFTVGNDLTVNGVGTSYHWVAFRGAPDQMVVGSFVGDGSDDRSISGVGFQPDYILIASEDAEHPMQRFALMPGDASVRYSGNGVESDVVQRLEVDGFEVGSSKKVNEAGRTFHYVAWQVFPDRVAMGSYPGSSVGGRAISTGFTPDHVIVRNTTRPAVHRPQGVPAAASLSFTDDTAVFDGITAFLSDGFEVGTNDWGNELGKEHYWIAFHHAEDVDLRVAKSSNNPTPNEGDGVVFTVSVLNQGPGQATNIRLLDQLPAGLQLQGLLVSHGSYDPPSGIWWIPTLANGEQATLLLGATVDPGTAGQTIENTVALQSLDQAELDASNDTSSAVLKVRGADIAVGKTVDKPSPRENEVVVFTITATNRGPADIGTLEISDSLPAGLTYSSNTPTHGSFDPGTGLWAVGPLAFNETAVLTLRAVVDPGTVGSNLVNTASVSAADVGDPVASNNLDSAAVDVAGVPTGEILVEGSQPTPGTLLPGGKEEEVFRLLLANGTSEPETLTAVSLISANIGPGTQNDLDKSWSDLQLHLLVGATLPPGSLPLDTVTVASGRADFSGFSIAIPADKSVVLVVLGAATLTARDSDTLDLEVTARTDLTLTRPAPLSTSFPLAPTGGFAVDGMVSAQIGRQIVSGDGLATGSVRNLAMDVTLPPNGYEADVLLSLSVINQASALASDIAGMEAWADDGDGNFDAGIDTRLGALVFTGNRWQVSGLSEPIPTSGLRIYVTVDIANDAATGRTLRLALPTQPEVSVGVLSGNDGPIDAAVSNGADLVITAADRVTLVALPVAPGSVEPGTNEVILLPFDMTNSYPGIRTLAELALTNASTGVGDIGQLDGLVRQLRLRADGNGDGVLGSVADDPVLATGVFDNQRVVFTGMSRQIASAETQRLWVTADVSLVAAADGDVIGAVVSGEIDITFAEGALVSAIWPLDSGARWTVDGMIAAQITNFGGPAATLVGGDGPVVALDVLIPPNGYADDELSGFQVLNLGTATNTDVAELRLWRDDGDGVFEPGSGDVDLGTLAWFGTSWQRSFLSEPLSGLGGRLFVGLTVATTPTDSSTVQLALPQNGLEVASGNDGPHDVAVSYPQPMLLSSDNLAVTLAISPAVSTVGSTVNVSMIVRNATTEQVDGITPSTLIALGDGTMAPTGGPTPASFDLAPGAEDTFTWTYSTSAPGDVQLSGSAEGLGAVSSSTRRSLTSFSNVHGIQLEADNISLFAVGTLPTSVNRGETDVVAFNVTFTHPAGDQTSDILLRRLRVELTDGGSTPVVPADLLTRVVVNEGSTVYVEKTALETTGSTIDLPLAVPVRVTPAEPVTLSLGLDIADSTVVPDFQVLLTDSTAVTAEDAVSAALVTVDLQGATFPVSSGVATVVAPAARLNVSGAPPLLVHTAAGIVDVEAMTLTLVNEGAQISTSDLKLSGFSVVFTDENDVPLADPSVFVQRIRARDAGGILEEIAVTTGSPSTVALTFSPTMTLPADVPRAVTLEVDIADAPQLGTLRLRLADPTLFDARDVNTGDTVSVVYASDPLVGSTLLVEDAATEIFAAGIGTMPPLVSLGAVNLEVMSVVLAHPGGAGTAPVRCDELQVLVRNQSGGILSPAAMVSRLRVSYRGNAIADLTNLPAAIGPFVVAFPAVEIPAGQSDTLRFTMDIAASAPLTSLGLEVPLSGVHAVGVATGNTVTVRSPNGIDLPLRSGLTQLQVPARELRVSLTSLMPAVLSPQGTEVPVARVALQNGAAVGAGSIFLEDITFSGADTDFSSVDLGAVVTSVTAWNGAVLWGASDLLVETDSQAIVIASDPLVLEAQESIDLEIRATMRATTTAASLRTGLEATGLGVIQPESALLNVSVEPVAGSVFPFWTDVGNFTVEDLEESFSSFPNPFAAGRDVTTVVFFLEESARVSLAVYSLSGDRVIQLLDNSPFDQGLHESAQWDGRNSQGDPVRNGTFLARLRVRYDSGREETLTRKIAVLR